MQGTPDVHKSSINVAGDKSFILIKEAIYPYEGEAAAFKAIKMSPIMIEKLGDVTPTDAIEMVKNIPTDSLDRRQFELSHPDDAAILYAVAAQMVEGKYSFLASQNETATSTTRPIDPEITGDAQLDLVQPNQAPIANQTPIADRQKMLELWYEAGGTDNPSEATPEVRKKFAQLARDSGLEPHPTLAGQN